MNSKLFLTILGAWFLFMILAIINGLIRNVVYKPIVGDLVAHQISSIIFIAVILIVTYIIFKLTSLKLNDSEALLTGTIWLTMTIVFEFIAGHYVFGNPWENIFADYDLFKGRLWSIVLLFIFLSPYIVNKIK